MNTVIDPRIDEVIHFWFDETTPEQKFKKDDAFDALIKSRFRGVYDDIVSGNTQHWSESPRGILAQIIVLDQFSRNMFRADKKSFAYDEMALGLAMMAVKTGIDQELTQEQRGSVYMPYMHSESRQIHEEALKIFSNYGNAVSLEFEKKHKNIIDRFGRYPHRNEVLGRESTPEEKEFLKTNSGF